jgi:hypothetical protein
VAAPRPSHARPLVAGVALLGLVLALAACGGGSSPSGAAGGRQRGPGGGGFAAARDPKVQACLKQQGVALPARRGGGRPGTGAATTPRPPTGTTARPPGGVRGDPAQFAKLRAALAKCGVQLPDRGPGGPGAPAQAPTSTTTS